MGWLVYGNRNTYQFDDRTLAHLQIVIGLKLRRREGFFFSWDEPVEAGSGRTSIWIEPRIPLEFRYSRNRPAAISREWLQALTELSNSAGGLRLVEEVPQDQIATIDIEAPPPPGG